ncbi:unnamed protein product [Rhizoctonia solani]|nr:unnamed protein product [Rhizoctonia solani]
MDTQLNDAGKAQAKITGKSLKGVNFVRAYSSDLSRAADTAKAILTYHPDCELVLDHRIRERNIGSLSGTKGPVKRPFPPEVETSESLEARLLDFWENTIIPLLSPPNITDDSGSPGTKLGVAPLTNSIPHTVSLESRTPAVLLVSHGATINKLLTQVLLRTYGYKAACEMRRGIYNTSISIVHISTAMAIPHPLPSNDRNHAKELEQPRVSVSGALISARDFVAVTAPPDPPSLAEERDPTPEPPTTRRAANKKKRAPKSKSRPKVSAAARKRKRVEESEEEDAEMSDTWSDLDEEIPLSSGEDQVTPLETRPTRRSARHKSAPRAHDIDEEMRGESGVGPSDPPNELAPVVKLEPDDTAGLQNLLTISADDEVAPSPLSHSPRPPSDSLVVEEEEEKPKQELQLAYTGYMVPSRCLCVIAEPWPALPTPAQLASQATKSRSNPPAPSPETSRPLFRPESDDEDEQPNTRVQRGPPTPEFDSDDEEARLRMFSQMINKVGERRSGVATRGAMDEFEDDALYGDADEEGRGI